MAVGKEKIIELKNITKTYDNGFTAVSDFNLYVKRGEFVTFLGPSGCGKTTTLRMIAGFELPSSGTILLNGKNIAALPPYERPINTVFQRYALFPHMNIYENIAFGLRQKKMPEDVISKKVKKVLDLVDLEGFEKRSVSTLSGGQQQRIAIARALVNEPEILLLDEPLGALDLKMRKEMQLELKEMHRNLGITFIYVTHDQEEALTMSDTIVVMSEGRIQQIGTPEISAERLQWIHECIVRKPFDDFCAAAFAAEMSVSLAEFEAQYQKGIGISFTDDITRSILHYGLMRMQNDDLTAEEAAQSAFDGHGGVVFHEVLHLSGNLFCHRTRMLNFCKIKSYFTFLHCYSIVCLLFLHYNSDCKDTTFFININKKSLKKNKISQNVKYIMRNFSLV